MAQRHSRVPSSTKRKQRKLFGVNCQPIIENLEAGQVVGTETLGGKVVHTEQQFRQLLRELHDELDPNGGTL
jgi:hypothetical protein